MIPQADGYLLKHILHDKEEKKAIAVVSVIRQANENSTQKRVTVFIVEYIILPDGAVSNWQSHGIDVFMASIHGTAKERTQEEYQYLLEQLGFQFKQLYPIQAPNSIVEALFVKE
jgi:hypothetical protein